MMKQDTISAWMKHAIRLGSQGVGRTAENPSVGCVILDKSDRLVGAARTCDGGRPHAEVMALAQAGHQALGGTAFVTLEPCSHHGQTGPCAQALIDAGIKRVFVGVQDPDSRVSGKGITALKQAGLQVETGICEVECRHSLRGFLSRIEKKRPFIQLKLATTLDAKTALANGQSKWITGELARRYVHLQRSEADAILLGAATLSFDNPKLDVRLRGLEVYSPRPVILDSKAQFSTADLRAKFPNLLHYTHENSTLTDGSIDLTKLMDDLGREGINTLYVESGGKLATSLIKAGLVDELIWFRAAKLFGSDAQPAFGALGLNQVGDALALKRLHSRDFGDDIMEIYQFCSQD